MTLNSGTRLGPYEILSAIGAGGMGDVYKARDTRLDRTVAIKVLPAHLATDTHFRERFEREAHAIAALQHPHICVLHDVGHQGGTDFLVMEYLDGETLAARLAKGPLPLEQAIQYAIEIADALDKAHRQGITHRDLKPGNIMLARSAGQSGLPQTKLLDFGLAKLRPNTTGRVAQDFSPAGPGGQSALPTMSAPLTGQGTILGTLQYMAPEQLEGKDADARTDIFAFGAIVYEMVTGRKAFEGKSHASLIAAILEHEPPPITASQPLTPPALDRVVKKCLAKEPDHRWQSARDLGDELRWITESDATSKATASGVVRVGRRARVGWITAALLAAAVVGAAAMALALWSRAGDTSDDRIVRFEMNSPATVRAWATGSGPRVSPDGGQVAFVATTVDGKTLLWVRALDSLNARPLPGTEGAQMPFWSPDSRWLGFGAGGKLKKIDTAGGFPETLCDIGGDQRGGAWNRDDVIVFTGIAGGLSRVSAAGGTPTPLTTLDPARRENSHRWPQFLPDGRHFLFTARSEQPEYHGIYVGSIDSTERKRLVSALSNAAYAPPGFLVFFRDGNLFAQRFDAARLEMGGEPVLVVQHVLYASGSAVAAFSVSEHGLLTYTSAGEGPASPLIWVDRGGRQIAVAGKGIRPAVSPDGARVAVTRNDPQVGTTDLWLIDASRGIDTPLTRHPAYDQNPVWSPDGTRIVFSSQREGPAKLYQKSVGGGAVEERLLDSTTLNRPMDWTADGRFIVYMNQDPRTNMDLLALPLTGDRKPIPIARSEFAESQGQVSKDGRWIAYSSDESGRSEIYVQAFPAGGRTWRVSSNGGSDPRWRRDGKELFYLASDSKLMAVPVAAAGVPEFAAPVALFDTRISDPLRDFRFYDVSPDGQRFVLSAGADAPPPITVVLNWMAALKN